MSTATESTHRTPVNLSFLDGGGNGDRSFPRIARPVELLRHKYDVIVIGSGYGGAVAASHMARAGQSVCLLERGKERWPCEFPSGTVECLEELAVSGENEGLARVSHGGPTSLYQLVLGEGQNAFVGSGLGGTSLLNANVFLRADAGTMSLPYWPEELSREGELDEYYNLAESMLEPEPYPEDWPELQKLKVLEKQARDLGWADKFYRVPQTTRFRHGMNSTGVPMNPSALTGQDATGLNDGSKSTTLVNYLADAWNWGTEMFCECEVRYVTKHPVSGYLVFFAWHGSGRDKFGERLYEDLLWVHARHCVFLGAGSLGTTEILLRSKQYGLDMSNRVGKGMSGNGDILAFGYNCDVPVNAMGREFPSPYHPIGPCITGIIDNRTGHANPLDGFVIEEGVVPKALVPMFQMMCELMPGNILDPNAGYLEMLKKKLASHGSAIRGPYYDKGSVERTQIYLIMSHDANQAILSLKDDKPCLKFLGIGRSEHIEYLNSVLARATVAVGGTFVNNPFTAFGKQEVTVHPIGGACISQDGTGCYGATNHFGEVFTGAGIETHKGLVVIDGAAVPTALGVNPFATITALAERSVCNTAERFGWSIDYTPNEGVLDLFGFPKVVITDDAGMTEAQALIHETRTGKVPGFEFSEVMEGFIDFNSGYSMAGDRLEDFEHAARIARGNCSAVRIFVSVKSWNTETTVRRPDHSAMLTGTLACAGLPGGPFMIARGSFGLFTENESISGRKNLRYHAIMIGTDGAQYRFNGFKVLDSSVVLNPLQLWRRTTTLYVSISRLDGPVIGRGMLCISLANFAKEASTMRPSGDSYLTRVCSTVSFLGYFASSLASLFLTPFMPLQYPHHGVTGQSIRLTASDGVHSYMHVYAPTITNMPVHDILFIPGASVDQAIFALETIDKNAVNYFMEHGYRCWVLVHRIGYNMRPNDQWTTYDARLDIAEALRYIRSAQALDSVYVVAHCMGAVAFSSGLLDGSIPPSWIRGITASQVFCNPIWARLNMEKVLSPLPVTTIYKCLAGNWFGTISSPNDTLFQRTLNQVFRFYPVEPEEVCNNIACHRTSFMFGRLWNHANLNSATHAQTHLFLSGVTMALENLLMPMGHRGVVTSNFPLAQDLVSKEAIRRLQGIPIFLFSGEDNHVLRAESTLRSYEILQDTNGAVGYEREVMPGYGHLDCWMGARACVDVYPMVEERVRLRKGKGKDVNGEGMKEGPSQYEKVQKVE
ncbi:hypothetical protein M422DRAFT_74769 [Sphaerobolus stellatus SS14]|nr:hypothetical protein M422DRAFT_74769 [Sphaerobolus stellatus SS14]